MSRRSKHLWLIILAQAACVAAGLWMQHQYVRASVDRVAEELTRDELAVLADNLVAALRPLMPEGLAPHTAQYGRIRRTLATYDVVRTGAMVIDREWRVVAQADSADAEPGSRLAQGQRISWEPTAEPSEQPAAPLQGNLALPDGPYIAAAAGLNGSSGYVLVYRSVAEVTASSDGLMSSLPSLSGMTFLWTCALLSIIVFLILGRFHDEVERERKQTTAETLRRSQNLVRMRDAVIFGLAKLADSRDPETGDHLERISIYSTMLASAVQRHPKFRDEVTPAFVSLIGISTALHDIGKVGIEDSILRKPGGLSAEQTARMRTHTTIGGDCLREIELRLGSSNFLQMAREIAFAHHERWDGSGYPNGIARDAIPLSARIAAIADVYDALSSKRVYSAAFPHEECVAIIRSQAGMGFDPDLVEVWLTIEHRFGETALQYASDSADEEGTSTAEDVDEPYRDAWQDALVSRTAVGEG